MRKKAQAEITAAAAHNWRTTDEEKINRRRLHSRTEALVKKPLPVDRPLGFAQAARQRLNGALVQCEERFPQDGPHSILYVVVERHAARWRKQLVALHRDFFGPGQSGPLAPVRLEVIDRATDDALHRLKDAGLVSITMRATRALWPAEEGVAPPPLSEAEREKAASFRSKAARKLRMAGVLAGGDLGEEARQALIDAIEPLGCALAVESRLPEPQSLEDALLPPLGSAWKEALPLVRNFLRQPSQPAPPLLSALGRV